MPTCTGRHVRLYDEPGDEPYILDVDWADRDSDQVVGSNMGRQLHDGETCVALIESMMTEGFVVTRAARTRSPNGLAWPSVRPRQRPPRFRPTCLACSTDGHPSRCRRLR